MIRDEWRLAIQVEAHGWVRSTKFERALNLKGFEYARLIGKLMKEWWFTPSVLELNLSEKKSNWKYGTDWEKDG